MKCAAAITFVCIAFVSPALASYDRLSQRNRARHVTAKRSLQETLRSNILQSDPLVQRRDNRCISCKRAGIRRRMREFSPVFLELIMAIETGGGGNEPAGAERHRRSP